LLALARNTMLRERHATQYLFVLLRNALPNAESLREHRVIGGMSPPHFDRRGALMAHRNADIYDLKAYRAGSPQRGFRLRRRRMSRRLQVPAPTAAPRPRSEAVSAGFFRHTRGVLRLLAGAAAGSAPRARRRPRPGAGAEMVQPARGSYIQHGIPIPEPPVSTKSVTIAVSDDVQVSGLQVSGLQVSGLLQSPPHPRAAYVLLTAPAPAWPIRSWLQSPPACCNAISQPCAISFLTWSAAASGPTHPPSPRNVRAAVAQMVHLLPDTPLFAGGKSFGGRMTSQAQAATPLPGVRGLIFLGSA